MSHSSPEHQPSGVTPNFAFQAPRRITITVPYAAYTQLMQRSDYEGRSLSNLAAFLLEQAITD